MDEKYTDLFGAAVRLALIDYKRGVEARRRGEPVGIHYASAKSFLFGPNGLEHFYKRVPDLDSIMSLESVREEAQRPYDPNQYTKTYYQSRGVEYDLSE